MGFKQLEKEAVLSSIVEESETATGRGLLLIRQQNQVLLLKNQLQELKK